MAYKISNLGLWETYTPNPIPEFVPANAIFARRKSDKRDWYGFLKEIGDFNLKTVYATAIPYAYGNAVVAVQRDPDMLFPAGCYLIKIEGVPEDEEFPHKLFEQQNYDPTTGTITPFPARAGQTITYKREMWSRMTDDEAATLDADLLAQSARIRRQFDDAQYIDHADPLFTMMHAAITGHFGESRANEILAPSK